MGHKLQLTRWKYRVLSFKGGGMMRKFQTYNLHCWHLLSVHAIITQLTQHETTSDY